MNDLLNDAIEEKDYNKVIEICDGHLFNKNQDDYLKYSIIKSVSLVQIQRIKEAKEILLNLFKSDYKTIDVEFLLSHIFYLTNDYDNAVLFGAVYLEHIKDKKENGSSSYTDARYKSHEICNNLGIMSQRLNKIDEALLFFNKGIELKGDYPLLYQNLGVVYGVLGDWDKARQIMEQGREKCPDDPEIHRILGIVYRSLYCFGKSNEELMMSVGLSSKEALFDLAINYRILCKFKQANLWMEKYLFFNPESIESNKFIKEIKNHPIYRRREPTISVCMIVKDEEDMIGKCLESILDVADEIVVVDTGSKDDTVEIAKSFGAKIFHHKWNDDFSEARNYSLSYATGDWILIIDADEVLESEDIPKVLEAKWQKQFDAVCFAIYSVLPGQIGGINMGKNYSGRLFKNRKSIYYEGIVHNVLHLPKKTATSDIRMYHYGYDLRTDKMQKKFERSIKLLLKQIDDNPNDAFARYNTAQLYLSRYYVKEAEEHALKIIEILSPEDQKQQHLYLMGLYQLALVNLYKNNFEKSEEYCLTALKIMEDYIDLVHVLMWIYFIQERFDEAEKMCFKLLELIDKKINKESFNSLILNKLGSDYEAYYVLAEISNRREDFINAKEYINKCLQYNPYYWKAYRFLGDILMREGDYKKASECFEFGIKYGYLNAEKYGTIGAKRKDYSSMLDEYKTAIEKSITLK